MKEGYTRADGAEGSCGTPAGNPVQPAAAFIPSAGDGKSGSRRPEARPVCRISGHIVRWMAGGVLYGILEVLYRGYTHWTMMLLAALLCIPLDIANEHMPWTLPLWLQALAGGLAITAGELAAGLILNVWLDRGIWDYSSLPCNLWGQICLRFSALWCLLAAPAIVFFDWLDYWICDGSRPRYKRPRQ